MFPMSMTRHLASFILAKAKTMARGMITAIAVIGVRSKSTVSNISTGKRMIMKREKRQVQMILSGIES